MKKWLLRIFVFLTVIPATQARDNTSILKIRLSNNEPLVVVIDDRKYDKVGRSITIGDLPRGWHELKVYEFLEYKKGGGRAEMLYSGKIKVKRGEVMYCVVDVRSQRIQVKVADLEDIYNAQEQPQPEQRKIKVTTVEGGMSIDEMYSVRDKVLGYDVDTKRMKALQKELEGKTFTTSQLKVMMEWLAFESSRLELAKWAYSSVSDTGHYADLEELFTIESSKEELREYIKKKQE